MNICIVGHGPSMKGSSLGKQIDSFDKVVRLKGSHTVLWTQDFGQKTHALCSSTEILGTFFKQDAPEYWAYPKLGKYDVRTTMRVIEKLQKPVMVPLQFCEHWNQRFRQMGATHNNVSTGMGAILISIHRWLPDTIALAGFDTLLYGDKFNRDKRVPRSGIGDYPNHDWDRERELLEKLRQTYNVEIEDINARPFNSHITETG